MRILNPEAAIRLAGGRTRIKHLEERLLQCGVSALIVGDMLTTTGSDIETDKRMFIRCGFECNVRYAPELRISREMLNFAHRSSEPMKSWKIGLILLGCLWTGMLPAQNSVLEFPQQVWNFGTIREADGAVSHEFEFENKGNRRS
ncbi:MAG: hypothetical protein ACLUEV_01490 [Alistipes sp.]